MRPQWVVGRALLCQHEGGEAGEKPKAIGSPGQRFTATLVSTALSGRSDTRIAPWCAEEADSAVGSKA